MGSELSSLCLCLLHISIFLQSPDIKSNKNKCPQYQRISSAFSLKYEAIDVIIRRDARCISSGLGTSKINTLLIFWISADFLCRMKMFKWLKHLLRMHAIIWFWWIYIIWRLLEPFDAFYLELVWDMIRIIGVTPYCTNPFFSAPRCTIPRSGSYQLNKEGRLTAAASCAGGIQFYLYWLWDIYFGSGFQLVYFGVGWCVLYSLLLLG